MSRHCLFFIFLFFLTFVANAEELHVRAVVKENLATTVGTAKKVCDRCTRPDLQMYQDDCESDDLFCDGGLFM